MRSMGGADGVEFWEGRVGGVVEHSGVWLSLVAEGVVLNLCGGESYRVSLW